MIGDVHLTCDLAAINRLTFFFVDDSSNGDLLIGVLQPDKYNAGL